MVSNTAVSKPFNVQGSKDFSVHQEAEGSLHGEVLENQTFISSECRNLYKIILKINK